MKYLKLAWRNIWRNKRRTLITTASILFALFFALILRSMQKGTYTNMIDEVVQTYTGHIQIHRKGYWNDKKIDNTFVGSDSLIKKIEENSNVKMVVPRLESFALAAYGNQTKGVSLVGIYPERENKMTHIREKLVSGRYLTKNDSGVLVAQKLAKYLQIKTNDTLILLSQGYHGESAAGKYPVRGILHFPSPELNNQMVYMSLPACEYFFSAPHRLTSIAINLKKEEDINKTVAELKQTLKGGDYEIMTWDEMLQNIVQAIKLDNAVGLVYLYILYSIIAFGIFGTVLMMTAERIKEFGVMISIGMQKTKLAIIVTLEMIILGFLGVISGIITSFPIILYYHFNPVRIGGKMAAKAESFGIDPLLCFAIHKDIYMYQSMAVFIMVLVAIIYPISRIYKLNIINAIRRR